MTQTEPDTLYYDHLTKEFVGLQCREELEESAMLWLCLTSREKLGAVHAGALLPEAPVQFLERLVSLSFSTAH